MKKWHKKGIGMEYVMGMLLIAIAVILFTPLLDVILSFISSGGNDAACTISLIDGKGTARCPVDEVIIKKDKADVNGKTFLRQGSKSQDDMAKEAIARLMQRCLSRGGGLNSKAFSADKFFGKTIACLECSEIKFEEKTGPIIGLTDYIKQKENRGIKYIDIFAKDEQNKEVYLKIDAGHTATLWPSESEKPLPKSNEYSIIFIGFKSSEIRNLGNTIWSFIKVDFYEAFFGTTDKYMVFLTKSQDLGEICEVKVN